VAKVNQDFRYEIYRFIHKPIRTEDQLHGKQFLERFTFGFQRHMEIAFEKINKLVELYDPAKTTQPRYLKDIVGFTKELDKITNDISDDDLRKLISLAVPLWKEKGLEVGYKDIVRLFTGKNSRVFNWFDYRYIVGEQGLAQEELGEDSWFISKPGVEELIPSGNVVHLLPFEQDFKDRSLTKMDAVIHGEHDFFSPGVLLGSDHYLWLFDEGIIEVPNSSKFDFSGDFTIEGFVKGKIEQNGLLWSKKAGAKEISIRYSALTDEIIYRLSDGVVTITETLASGVDLADNVMRHYALVINRTENLARFYFSGAALSVGEDITTLGDPSNSGKIWIGGSGPGLELLECGLDALRISLSAQYDLTQPTITIPAVKFIPYIEEQLDEFFSDVRVVDEGDLNRVLNLRILNLMRPSSERLRVIYIRFFEDFEFGKGGLRTDISGSFIDTINRELVLPSEALETADIIDALNFKDIVLQTRARIVIGTGYSIRFMVQNSTNYYEFKMRSDNSTFELSKIIGGVKTSIATPVSAEIYGDVYYVLTVVTDFNEATNETLIKCYQDRNLVFEVIDSEFEKGTWAIQSEAGSECRLSEIEMFLMPLELDIIEPNADL